MNSRRMLLIAHPLARVQAFRTIGGELQEHVFQALLHGRDDRAHVDVAGHQAADHLGDELVLGTGVHDDVALVLAHPAGGAIVRMISSAWLWFPVSTLTAWLAGLQLGDRSLDDHLAPC